MKLMEGERSLGSSWLVTLTTHRLIEESAHGSKTIMLEQLCSTSMVRETKPIWLFVSPLPLALGILYSSKTWIDTGWQSGLAITGLCVLAYFLTASRRLILASTGAAITISAGGRDIAKFRDFVNLVDAAKDERYRLGKAGATQNVEA